MAFTMYPQRLKIKKRPEKLDLSRIYKNPHVIMVFLTILALIGVVIYHFATYDNKILKSDKGEKISFTQSRHFKEKQEEIYTAQQKRLIEQMDISANAEVLSPKAAADIKIENIKEQRQLVNIRKYEAIRYTMEERNQEREARRKHLESPQAARLKDAVMALEDSETLGILKLESFIKDKGYSATPEEAELVIYAYDKLAKAYMDKNLPSKAKETYSDMLQLMKKNAPTQEASAMLDRGIKNLQEIPDNPTLPSGR
ncbi:MAG: hypothetical protein GX221_03335 [Candidatus Riflebacteria bacterium]|nr:hypothetical protein [Candidatus Riflebacteria bacterium]